MKPAAFQMQRPTRLEEALELLDQEPDARVIAGGQSLVPMMNLRLVTPALLVDLNRVDGLAGIRVQGNSLRIGAMTRQHQLASDPLVHMHAPLLAQAMPHVGHVQTRNRGTIGGSLAHADPSAELPVTMVALGATLHMRSRHQARSMPAGDFFVDVLTTAMRPGEILFEIEIPLAPPGTRAHFTEFARRRGDFAIAACAAQYVSAGAGQLSLALGGVAKVPHRCDKAIAMLSAAGFSRAAVSTAVEAECSGLSPLSDLHADAELRRQLARTAITRSLMEVLP